MGGEKTAVRQATAAARDDDLEALAAFVLRYPRLAVLSGAGISTASGIPDYRDDRGDWKRRPPMQHQVFMASHAARQRYWARALVGFRTLQDARPNAAHAAVARLEALGLVSGVITQNVDGLHQRAGSRRVVDLHGRADMVRCMSCGARRMRHDLHAELAARNPRWLESGARAGPDGDADLEADFSGFRVPDCTRCGEGIYKPDVVFFGDSVPRDTVAAAFALQAESAALLVVGSSLMVFSGFRFAREAAQVGQPIACLNLGRTRADDLYTLKVKAPAEALSALCDKLEGDSLRGLNRRPA
ncbi:MULTISPECIES: NAD-dependent protein deacetylase [Halomonas]|uniref:protein acetyllysine N-acetyltransferase n=1 Tax=Halomonas ventosae TaxID=229007 RepID=A0A4R6GQI5_9GAMM|nr:NAD-dependent protein deacetylase [Halomonas ventosae]TDN96814.1 NAD-dependent SIR2 family protein deacetylase [Halomonas ventosae]